MKIEIEISEQEFEQLARIMRRKATMWLAQIDSPDLIDEVARRVYVAAKHKGE